MIDLLEGWFSVATLNYRVALFFPFLGVSLIRWFNGWMVGWSVAISWENAGSWWLIDAWCLGCPNGVLLKAPLVRKFVLGCFSLISHFWGVPTSVPIFSGPQLLWHIWALIIKFQLWMVFFTTHKSAKICEHGRFSAADSMLQCCMNASQSGSAEDLLGAPRFCHPHQGRVEISVG